MKLTDLLLNRWLYKTPLQNMETKDAVYDASNVVPAPVPALAAGSAAQDLNTGNVNINGTVIEPGTIPPTTLDVSNWGWGQTCAFSSVSDVQVNWGAGTFKSANGISYSISAGNTGTMSAKTYIYLDLLVSSTSYQITTNPALAVGIGKVLIGVAQNSTAPDNAVYNLSEATQITGDNILANSIDASKITAGTITVLGAVTAGSFAIGTKAWHLDASGNMWWGNYTAFNDALDKISSSGIWSRIRVTSSVGDVGFRYENTSNNNNVALDIITSDGSTTNTGNLAMIRIVHGGTGNLFEGTIVNSGGGIYISRSVGSSSASDIRLLNLISTGNTFIQVEKNGGGNTIGANFDQTISNNFAGVNNTAIKMNLATGGANSKPYAFSFQGSEKGITAAGNGGFSSNSKGTFTLVGFISIEVGSTQYYVPYGTIA